MQHVVGQPAVPARERLHHARDHFARGSPVWLRKGSTRFAALVVPLSDSFSRPTRSTSIIFAASMS